MKRQPLPALSQSMPLRFVVLFVALFSQGFPLGLFFIAIPTWLAANGVEAGAIGGFLAAATLPWTFKFAAAFLMDRFAFLPMGKRRAWLIASQILIVVFLLVSAAQAPNFSDIALLSVIAFAVNAACAFQDAAISGLAVDLVPDNERARANSILIAGETFGTAIGAALSGLLIARYDVSFALLAMAVVVLVSVSLFLYARERPGERRWPWSVGQASAESERHQATAWLPLVRSVWSAMRTRESLLLVIATTANAFTYGLYAVAAPIIATTFGGWSDEDFSALNGLAALIAGAAGLFVFGILVDQIGTRVGGTIGMLGYAIIGVIFVLTAPLWHAPSIFIAVVLAAYLTDAMMRVGTYSTAMRLCRPEVAATQYAIYMALTNLGTISASLMVGWLDDLGGTTALLLTGSGVGILGTAAYWAIRRSDTATEPA